MRARWVLLWCSAAVGAPRHVTGRRFQPQWHPSPRRRSARAVCQALGDSDVQSAGHPPEELSALHEEAALAETSRVVSSPVVLRPKPSELQEWPFGTMRTDAGLQLKAWVPHADAVMLELRTNGADDSGGVERLVLFPDAERATWGGVVKGQLPHGTWYRFVVLSNCNHCFDAEGVELIRRDPYAREADFHSAWCAVPPPAAHFPWKHSVPPQEAIVPWHKLNLYELHVGSFTPEGSFTAAAAALEHVAALGFTGIQLMPCTEFGGAWGYNPRQLMTVHSPWGSADDLRRLVDRAHELGLACLVDVVLNHGSSKNNTLWMWDGYGPDNNGGIYFETGKDTPWGRQFSFDKPEVLSYLTDAARMWLEEFNMDGLRMDSVHNQPWSLSQHVTHTLRKQFPGKIMIAEICPETPDAIHGAGFDSIWFHFPHFDAIKIVEKQTDGSNTLPIIRHLMNLPRGYNSGFNGVSSILGSHDQIGCRKNGARDGEGKLHRHFVERVGGRDNWHARAQTRMWWAINATGRPMPMLFMGDEFLQTGFWHCGDNKHEWMQWPGEIDQAGAMISAAEVPPSLEGDALLRLQMARCVRGVNMLRSSTPAMTADGFVVSHQNGDCNILGVVRHAPASAVLVVVNASEAQFEDGSYEMPLEHLPFSVTAASLLFNSQAEQYGGWVGSAQEGQLPVTDNRVRLSIPKWGVQVYELSVL